MRALIFGGSLAVVASLGWTSMVPAVEAMQVGQSAPAVQGTPPPPGDTISLQEMHADWRVVCGQQKGQKVCSVSQQQTDQNSRQLLLAIELSASALDGLEGSLILPFGLALEQPVTLQVDDAAARSTHRFRTCFPVGCLVSLTLDSTTVGQLRKGTTLTVAATADSGQGVAFKISLNGFSSAVDRMAALAK